MNRRVVIASVLLACVVACRSDGTTGPEAAPSEVRNAPSVAIISGTPVGVTGLAYREFTPAGAAVGATHWTARVVSPPGTALPSLSAVELWYVSGANGERVTIASARLVTDVTDQFFEIQGTAGNQNPGTTADIVVRVRDASGNLFLIRAAGVPVQRYELLE